MLQAIRCEYFGAHEREGHYLIGVTRMGYKAGEATQDVEESDGCHVETRHVRINIEPSQ
jgi:hypothetical protein